MHLADAIAVTERSVVQLSFQITGPQGDIAHQLGGARFHRRVVGSGFLVDDEGHVATAKHVVDEAQGLVDSVEAATKELVVGLAAPNLETIRATFVSTPAAVVAEDAGNDVTILRMARPPAQLAPADIGDQPVMQGHAPATLAPHRPRDGEGIAISGYPLALAALVTNSGAIASSWDVTEPDKLDRYLADVQVAGGNRGGPVCRTSDASVIGVCVGQGASGLTVVVPVAAVLALLDEHGIAYAAATA